MLRALLAVLVGVAPLAAADLSGIWMGQIPNKNGEGIDIAFQFVQQGSRLTGKLYGDYVSTPIQDGLAAGDLVTFIVVAKEQAGNQINETRIRFTGKLQNGALELTRERESAIDAVNGAAVTFKNNPKQTFTLQKLTGATAR